MSELAAIVFDFDGVIAESVDIKTEAFTEMAKAYPPDVAERFIAYHLDNGGVSRRVKFEYLYGLLGEELTPERCDELDERFSAIVVEKIVACPFVPGAVEFLEAWRDRAGLFVASGTPEEELRDIVEAKGLTRFFAGVYGTPATKSEILARVLREHDWTDGQVVFIGDTATDLSEAAKAGVAFVGRRRAGNEELFASRGVPVVDDLFGLDRYLRRQHGAAADVIER